MALPHRLRKYLLRQGVTSSELRKRKRSKHLAANRRSRRHRIIGVCHLLSLPAELRNIIYGLAPREQATIEVTASLQIPGLLQTNHRMRQEASAIWYTGYQFVSTIHNSNATLHVKWQLHCARRCPPGHPSAVGYRLTGGVVWKNLMVWLLNRWKSKMKYNTPWPNPAGMVNPSVGRSEFVRAVNELLNTFLDRPFEDFAHALWCLRMAASAYDAALR